MGFWTKSISFDIYFIVTIVFIIFSLFAVERALSFGSIGPRTRQAVGFFISLAVFFIILSLILTNPFGWHDDISKWKSLMPSVLQ